MVCPVHVVVFVFVVVVFFFFVFRDPSFQMTFDTYHDAEEFADSLKGDFLIMTADASADNPEVGHDHTRACKQRSASGLDVFDLFSTPWRALGSI